MNLRPRPVRLLAVLGIAMTYVMSVGAPAGAHSGEESYVYLDIYESEIEGTVQFPFADMNEILDLDIPQDKEGALVAVEADYAEIRQYAADHLAMADETGAEAWPLVFGDDFEILELSAGGYVVVPFVVDREFDGVPQRFEVTYDGVVEAMPEKSALLILSNDWRAGEFNNEANHLLRYTSDSTTQIVDRNASFWTGFLTVVGLGTEHIEIGTDHILFVLALVIPAALVFTRGEGWRPTPSFGSGLWRVTKIATMFTIAHSITLALGGLGIVTLSPRPVETFIALSIAAAALHNVYPIFVNKEWILAFFFGLSHGLGFAGLLDELGLVDNNRVWSLLAFNVGIEFGQLLIIFLVFPVLFMLRRTRFYPVVLYGASLALAAAAFGWAAERALNLPERVGNVIDPVLAWPRAGLIVIGLGIVAAVYNRWEALRGELRSNDDLLPGPAFQRMGGDPRDDAPADGGHDDGPAEHTKDLEPVG